MTAQPIGRPFTRAQLFRRWGLAAVALIQVVGSTGAGHGQPGRRRLDVAGYLLLVAGPLTLALLRRRPALRVGVVTGVTLVYLICGYPYGPVFLSTAIALVLAVVTGHRLAAWIAASSLYLIHLAFIELLERHPRASWGLAIGAGAWILVVLAFGEIVRTRREAWMEASRSREAESLRRLGEERLRIARELHDVVAHNISLINVQAGVALHLLESNSSDAQVQAHSALSTIKQASKDALAELRSVLGILRDPNGDLDRTPTPSLSQLSELVVKVKGLGISVETLVEGTINDLPSAIGLAAYRILQEALTNVARHGASPRANVSVVRSENALTIQVDNPTAETVDTIEGNGITGMRERAIALGGTLETNVRAGRFRLRAVLPLEGGN